MLDLVEKLRGVPVGTPLYSTIHGECFLKYVDPNSHPYPIRVRVDSTTEASFTINGKYAATHDGECVLFPSKTQRDWNKFVPSRIEEDEVVLVSDNAHNWHVRYYSGRDKGCYMDGCDWDISQWKYVVPLDEFDFTDLLSNVTKSI
jgi:hypothetical protein